MTYEPWLNKLQLRQELGKLRKDGHPPHHRVIERLKANGMPSRVDPMTGSDVFLLSEVLRWINAQAPGILRRAS